MVGFVGAVKTIKDVKEEDWLEFKAMAAKNGIKMGKLFGILIKNYKTRKDDLWDYALNPKHTISSKDAEEMHKRVKKLRKEYGFR